MLKLRSWCVALLLISSGLNASESNSGEESIFGKVAVAETDIKISLKGSELEVAAQGLTLRTVKEQVVHTLKEGDDKIINDFTYRSYHLEFAFTQRHRVLHEVTVVEFYEGNDIIHSIPFDETNRLIASGNGRRYDANFIAINLKGMPLVLLDSVTRIDLR